MLLRAANAARCLLYIVTNAVLFSFVLSNENIPSALADWITAQDLGWVSCCTRQRVAADGQQFMEPTSIVLIMAPILAPPRNSSASISPFRYRDRRQYGVGLCPPVGHNRVASVIASIRI